MKKMYLGEYGNNGDAYGANTKAYAYDLTAAAIEYAETQAYGKAHREGATPESMAIWQTLNYIAQILDETRDYFADEDDARALIDAIEETEDELEARRAEEEAGIYILENCKPAPYAKEATTGYRYKLTETNTTHPQLVYMD